VTYRIRFEVEKESRGLKKNKFEYWKSSRDHLHIKTSHVNFKKLSSNWKTVTWPFKHYFAIYSHAWPSGFQFDIKKESRDL